MRQRSRSLLSEAGGIPGESQGRTMHVSDSDQERDLLAFSSKGRLREQYQGRRVESCEVDRQDSQADRIFSVAAVDRLFNAPLKDVVL